MNQRLAHVLIDLSNPTKMLEFDADEATFLAHYDLSTVDRLALLSRNKSVLKYQALFGDLTRDQLGFEFTAGDSQSEVDVDLAPNHEHDVDHDGDPEDEMSRRPRSYGPHMRLIGTRRLQDGSAT